tara:strand:+ start:148 stop:2037 length:1890 start_codon:yes stop_codon:yes gene_type:complete
MKNSDIINIQSDPKYFIQNLDIKSLENIIMNLNTLYYNKESPISDYQYDILYDGLKIKYTNSKLNFNKSPCYNVGSEISSNNKKYKLPYYCGSLDKIKPNTLELQKFLNKYKNNFIISEKIDGIPLLIEYNCNTFKVFTRGNGKEGLLLDNKILDVIDFPKYNVINKFTYLCIKGECVLNKNSNYKTNLRNVVNGILHKKNIDNNIKLNYIAYEILSPKANISNQFKILKKLEFKIPKYIHRNNFNDIENIYKIFREKSEYNIDGLVITHNENYPNIINKNPDYSKAFKMVLEQQIKKTIVTDVIWNVSKNGLLKPTIIFEPINIDKTNIQKTTGFNAKYIIDNSIGKDTILNIIKSGDVIPYVHSIIQSTKPILPNCNYKWNDSNIDFIITNLDNNEYKKSLLIHFCKEMEIKYINEGIIEILYNNNYNTINKIINMNISDFQSLPKFNNILSTKIYNSIYDKLNKPNLLNLLVASNVFGNGIGKKKVKSLLDSIPDVIKINIDDNLKQKLMNIEGFNTISVSKIIKGLYDFKNFIKDTNININNIEYINNNISNKLINKKIVFSGFRDKLLEEKIVNNGGNVYSNLSNNTNYLIVNDLNHKSKKIDLAKKLNINILSKNNFNTLLYG